MHQDEVIHDNRPIVKLTGPFLKFIHIQSASGIFLAICTIVALIIANTDYYHSYSEFWNYILKISIADFTLSYPLWYWINDGLMTVFFFVIGLEIKRELVLGELRNPRRVILPVSAAIAGAILPALMFFIILGDNPGKEGWAIPMATDIAFVVGAIAILGKRIPHGLKVFLLSLAIIDDIIAVIIIAAFYSASLKLIYLIIAVTGLLVMVIMNKSGIRNVWLYALVGIGIWLATLKSGIHPTIAGVAMGLLAPVTALISRDKLTSQIDSVNRLLLQEDLEKEKTTYREILDKTVFVTREAVSPLERIEAALHPWVAFLIMPLFALANAAVPIKLGQLSETLSLAVCFGLVIGKPLGIFLSSFIMVKLKLADLPVNVNWRMLLGAGCLAGIGFTMSLFIASLSLNDQTLNTAKLGIIIGSTVSIALGMVLLSFKNRVDQS